ncbi:MAG: beta-lactamase family protein [Bacteroidetes bacterium]|nr:beta-lactamase family protein [Bacteroidota bacterium]
MKRSYKIAAVAGLVFFSGLCYGQQTDYNKIDSIFDKLYETGQFSGSVLIAVNGKAQYQKSFGMADIEKRTENNQHTRFLLASVSKQFTAMGIVVLKEQGKLDFDDELVKYIPNLPYKGITIRQVLNHTSGLPDYMPLFEQHWDKTKFATNQDMLNMLIQYHPDPLFASGQKYMYSNTGYAVLALLIEKVSGMTFTDFMENKIFKPLGMNHTIIYTRRARPRSIDNYATGYQYDDSLKQFVRPEQHPVWKNALWEDGIYGEDGVNSTTGDILTWDQAVYKHSFISEEDWREILSPGKVAEGNMDYGFGWHTVTRPGIGRSVFHTGGWPGFMAYNEQGLDRNYSIIILRNKFSPQPRVPTDLIRLIICPERK